MPSPIYEAHNLCPSYLLRYSWTAFPAKGQRLPKTLPEGMMKNLAAAWESDGIRLLEHRWEDDRFRGSVDENGRHSSSDPLNRSPCIGRPAVPSPKTCKRVD